MKQNPYSLFSKTILITGASSGIGRAIAISCSEMGARLVLNGRNSLRLDETLALTSGDGHIKLISDLTDDLSDMVTGLPHLDGVVHCAGIGHAKLCKQIVSSEVDTVMAVNFKAPVLLQSELLRQKKINKGASIVFIASIGYHYPNIGNALYCASKGALISYANCLKLELAPRQIRVNCISPGMIWTDLILHDGMTEDQLREDEKKYLFQRYGQPCDVAHLAVYLLSDASSWMTGSNIEITGGAPRL